MFKIGEFSRLVQVPVKTLRYYDEIGLFKPAYVDETTGYRYYKADQLPKIHRILALRDLGFPLKQIAQLLEEGISPEALKGMLALRRAELRSQIEEAQRKLARVEWRLRMLEEGKMGNYEVLIKNVPGVRAALLRRTLPTYAHVGQLFSQIFSQLEKEGLKPAGPPFAIYHDTEYKENDVDVEAGVPVAASSAYAGEGISVREVPGGEMACLVYRGPYESIGEAYAYLISWISANGYRIGGPSREVYLRGPADQCSPDEYLTEIQFPVERG